MFSVSRKLVPVVLSLAVVGGVVGGSSAAYADPPAKAVQVNEPEAGKITPDTGNGKTRSSWIGILQKGPDGKLRLVANGIYQPVKLFDTRTAYGKNNVVNYLGTKVRISGACYSQNIIEARVIEIGPVSSVQLPSGERRFEGVLRYEAQDDVYLLEGLHGLAEGSSKVSFSKSFNVEPKPYVGEKVFLEGKDSLDFIKKVTKMGFLDAQQAVRPVDRVGEALPSTGLLVWDGVLVAGSDGQWILSNNVTDVVLKLDSNFDMDALRGQRVTVKGFAGYNSITVRALSAFGK